MFEGYFDESGGFEEEPKIFCISGYFISSEQAVKMDAEWGETLAEHSLSFFHMVDCAHGAGQFQGMGKEVRSNIARKFIELIKRYTWQGFSVIANGHAFETSDKDGDVYTQCAGMVVQALDAFLDTARIKSDVAFIFEDGHRSRGRAYNHIAKNLGELSTTVTFATKEAVRLLQAADILAWQSAKYAKDADSGRRPPRKDFLSLMEHTHELYFLTTKSGEVSFAIESWPLSRRSQSTVELTGDYTGPIPFFYERGENIPIISVSKSLGWRMGGGRMGYIAFTAVGEKRFYLAFEEIRLVEAIASLIEATKMYSDSGDAIPAIPAQGMTFHKGRNSAEIVLRVQLNKGSRMAFTLPRKVWARYFRTPGDED